MNRRRFLQVSSSVLLLGGCGFEYSPYQVTPTQHNLNAVNIARIVSMEATLNYPYSIALISDTHTYYDNYQDVAAHVRNNRDTYRFALHAGDLTDTGLQKEFDWNYAFSSDMLVPVVTAVGNHDALSNGVLIYKTMYGPFSFAFKAADNHYIFWNNNNWEFGPEAPDWGWLEDELAKAYAEVTLNGGQIIVVNHVAYDDPERYAVTEQEYYRQLMRTHEVSLCINGHDHDPEHQQDVDGVDYLTVGSIQKRLFVNLTITGPGRRDFTVEKIYV